jgi:hypothetical protein
MAATTQDRLAALEAEVAELRRAVVLREEFIETVKARAYGRGRASILGAGSGHTARRQAERRLQAVPDPEPEYEAGV